MHEGGDNSLKYLKKEGGTEKRGRETKIFKRGASWFKCLKKWWGLEPPLRTMLRVNKEIIYSISYNVPFYSTFSRMLKNSGVH